MPASILSILLADDHDVVLAGLRSTLERQPNVRIIGEAADGRAAVQLAQELSPDIVVMDISMPGLNGIEATRQIRGVAPEIKVITLSMHSDRQFVAAALKAGAVGYVLKNSAAAELPKALKAVTRGDIYLSPKITDIVVQDYVRHVPECQRPVSETLTAREREVLQLLAEGQTSKEIASVLHLSPKTVETHRSQIMERLDIHTVAELTKFAVREGITTLE